MNTPWCVLILTCSAFFSAQGCCQAHVSSLDQNQLHNRLLPDSGYVRSFSGVRFKNMGLQSTIALEDRALAFLDGYSYTQWLVKTSPLQKRFTLIMARDPRPTGQAILEGQVQGIQQAAQKEGREMELIDLGIATTPLWESAIREFHADGGVMITASHNPLQENGWKYGDSCARGGSLLDPSEMAAVLLRSKLNVQRVFAHEIDLMAMMNHSNTFPSNPTHFARAIKSYVQEQAPFVQGTDRSILLINDSNGGAAARVNQLVLEQLGFENILPLNTDLGVPNHKIEPIRGKKGEEFDPTKNGLIDVTKALQEKKGRVGIVYDFDADRGNLVLLDESGHVDEISPQDVAALNVAIALLNARRAGGNKPLAVVAHCATSFRTKEIASLLGAEMKTVEVGEVNVTKKMNELEKEGYLVPIGVEGYNGGTIFRGSQCRDGLQTLLSAASALSNTSLFSDWLEAKGEKDPQAVLKPILERGLYLTDFLAFLPRAISLQDKKTGIRLDQKKCKTVMEEALSRSLTQTKDSFYRLPHGRIYKEIMVEYTSETEIRSRSYDTAFIPGDQLEGPFIEGGWRIRFLDTNGRESMIWMRGSKTENGTYRTLADAPSLEEAEELQTFLNALFEAALK